VGAYFQASNVTQVFYTKSGEVVSLLPRFLTDVEDLLSTPHLEKVSSVLDFLRPHRRLVIEKGYALGDLLLLVPVIRRLKEELDSPHVTLITQYRFTESAVVRAFCASTFDAIIPQEQKLHFDSYDVGVYLDGVLERDHSVEGYSCRHRVQILMDWFGLSGRVNWSTERSWAKSKHILFQTGGSWLHKELPPETREFVIASLRKRKYDVRLAGRDNPLSSEDFLELIASAACVVTMDSSPLWVSHFTKTPCVLLLGPTRESERLTMHPLYPERAVAIALNKLVDCPSCFEKMDRCRGRLDCLNVDKKRVAKLVLRAVRRVM